MALNTHSSILVLLAGVAFFMYGMSRASDSLQKLTANRVSQLFSKISRNHFLSVAVGVALTVCLQSSGAVTSMLVGLGSAGVVSMQQVMGIIIGTAVGTTLTVQLISFNIAQYGLPLFTLAFMGQFMSRNRVLKELLTALMGMGLIFFGLEMIGLGTQIFQRVPEFAQIFAHLSKYPVLSFILATVLTGFVHSSAVTIGLAMTLATNGVLPMHDALYWVLGANVGTTATALMAAAGGNYVGRQVAWAHFFYKFISVLIFVVAIDWFAQAVGFFDGAVSRQIANAHLIYNLAAAVIFFPFIELGARWIQKFFPPLEHEKDFGVEFLKANTYQSPTLAVAHARREIMRMGDIVISMIEESLDLFRQSNPELTEGVTDKDNKVDLLHREIKLFLVKCAHDSGQGVSRETFELISFASDLESAADVIDHEVWSLAKKKHALKISFSASGWKEIEELHAMVVKVAKMSMSCFQLNDRKLAAEVIEMKREVRRFERKLRESHVERLNQGLQDTINTSSIHLDLLGDYRRVVGLMTSHAYQLAKRPKRSTKRQNPTDPDTEPV